MARSNTRPTIALPKSWTGCVRSAMLHVISLAQYTVVYTRSWAANSSNARVRLKAEKERAEQEAALLREEMRIKDARMAVIAPQRRPYYSTAARLEILQLRAARGWSLEQAADAFLVTAATVASCVNRLDERPNHVWHVDLTTVPTQLGMWCSWLPWALPQYSPFCWWLALVLDHHSRRVMGFAVFRRTPLSVEIRALLGRVIHAAGAAPKYLISDKGCQFWPSKGFKRWCKRQNIRPRFGAFGKHGSIAVIERLIGTLKREGLVGVTIP